jgi:hypothetical protein
MAPKEIDTQNFSPEGKDRKVLNEYIVARLKSYSELYDSQLWITFKNDFKAWTEEQIRGTPTDQLVALTNVLRDNGVFVSVAEGWLLTENLMAVLAEEKPHQWSDSEVIDHLKHGREIRSSLLTSEHETAITSYTGPRRVNVQHLPPLPDSPSPNPAQGRTLRSMTAAANAANANNSAAAPAGGATYETNPIITPLGGRARVPFTPAATTRFAEDTYEAATYERAPFQSQPAAQALTTPGTQSAHMPWYDVTAPNYAPQIAHLRKAYSEDIKFGDSMDSFDQAYDVFLDLCGQMGLRTEDACEQAFSNMLKGPALQYYYRWKNDWKRRGVHPAIGVKSNFETEEHIRTAQTQWDSISLHTIIQANPGKSISECLELMLQNMEKLFNKIRRENRMESMYHDRLIAATRTVPACHAATGKPAPTVSGLIESLRGSINQYEDTRRIAAQHMMEPQEEETLYTDRRFHYKGGRPPNRGPKPHRQQRGDQRICFLCRKPGHFVDAHTKEEIEAWKRQKLNDVNPRFHGRVRQLLSECEKDDSIDFGNEFANILLTEEEPEPEATPANMATTMFAAAYFGSEKKPQEEHGTVIARELANRATAHKLSSFFQTAGDDTVPENTFELEDSFVSESRYNMESFQGIVIDTGAAKFSTAGYNQFLAYKNTVKDVNLDTTTAGSVSIRFGAGDPKSSIGSVDVRTPVGIIRFHVLKSATPFLLCLTDMDILRIYFDNTRDVLVGPKPGMATPIVRRFGHPFLIWEYTNKHTVESHLIQSFDDNPCFLTETELRRLHRRFGHPSTDKLHRVLEQSGHEVDVEALKHLRKVCHHCQIHGASPGRFRFTLRDDVNFNHSIIVDIMYIDGHPVLHIIDEATRFCAARWLPDMSAKAVWDALRGAWIDTYLGPPDFMVTDAGKNFTSRELAQNASSVGTIVKTVPVEAHWSIGTIERYHAVLRRTYEILRAEIPNTSKELILQMAVKAINDTAGPKGLVPTLLVFGAYPRIVEYDPPAPTVAQRAAAVKKAMTELRKMHAKRDVNDAINMRNGPSTALLHSLPLNSDVLVWREGNTGYAGKWTGPYKLVGMEDETCTVDLPSGPTNFRSTVVKPYHRDDAPEEDTSEEDNDAEVLLPDPAPDSTPASTTTLPPSRRIPTVVIPTPRPQRERRPPRHYGDTLVQDDDVVLYLIEDKVYIGLKSTPFTESRQKEIRGLLEREVFEVVLPNQVPAGVRIFNARFVDEVKNAGTDKAFEKSRLVVQAYNDEDKLLVLTESPTIQRASQRIILCLTASTDGTRLYARDVTQAYIQSVTPLNRPFYIRPPPELAALLPLGALLRVVRPLYGIPEAGNHWFRTYHRHHTVELRMSTSTYDPCLLHCTDCNEGFGVVGLQTDDTLILADRAFADREEEEIERAGITCKPREELTPTNSLKFNGALISEDGQGITLTQERSCTNIRPVQDHPADIVNSRGKLRKDVSTRDQYVSQRALGAYIASMCQPEASFDLSFAAQTTDPQKEDIKALNKRLEWQLENSTRGLRFIKLDITTLKLIVFTDASFANNKDFSSQIGFVIVLADAANNANILHWSSIKCKRITRSVLASETYGLTHGFDSAAAIKSTITQLLHLEQPLPLVVCTDSKSLYECLVKLGTTQEKRLMIDLMCLRQSYERQEITEVKWIDGDSNPADAMTKSKPCRALQELIETNKLRLNINGWVERTAIPASTATL